MNIGICNWHIRIPLDVKSWGMEEILIKAVINEKFSPLDEILELQEMEKPLPVAKESFVKIIAASKYFDDMAFVHRKPDPGSTLRPS